MAVKSVAAPLAAIAASGAANNDTINIIARSETWKVTSSKLLVPSSSLTVKLANGNFAYLSTPDTEARNVIGTVPEFSNTATYTKGQAVSYNNVTFFALSDITAGSFSPAKWQSTTPSGGSGNVTLVYRIRPTSPGSSYYDNPSVEFGQWVIMFQLKDNGAVLSFTRKTDVSSTTDRYHAWSQIQKGDSTTIENAWYRGSLTKSSAAALGEASVSTGKLDFIGKTTIGFPEHGGCIEVNWGAYINASSRGWAVITYNGPALP